MLILEIAMPSFHQILIQLRNDLGYRKDEGGLCILYAEKAMDAFLVGEYDSVFKRRCQYIEQKYAQIPALLKQVKEANKALCRLHVRGFFARSITTDRSPLQSGITEEERQMILDVASFIEQGDLYMHPMYFAGVFGRVLNQSDIEAISSYAQSVALEKVGGRVCLVSFVGSYSQHEFITYLQQLNSLAQQSVHDFVLDLRSNNHCIALCYSAFQKHWQIMDANQPDIAPIAIHEQSIPDLSQALLDAFLHQEGPVTFQTLLFTTREKKPLMDRLVNTWKENEVITALHGLTDTHSSRESGQGTSLAWFAARAGDDAMLKEIITVTPLTQLQWERILFTAVFNGHIKVVHFLLESNPTNSLLIDLKKLRQGPNLLWIATENGHLDLVKLFWDLKTSTSDVIFDPYIVRKNGETLWSIAAQNGHFNVLRFLLNQLLLELTASPSHLMIDQLCLSNTVVNPLWIAAEQGHIDVVRLLLEMRTPVGGFLFPPLQKNSQDETALSIAIRQGHIDVVLLLLKTKDSDKAIFLL